MARSRIIFAQLLALALISGVGSTASAFTLIELLPMLHTRPLPTPACEPWGMAEPERTEFYTELASSTEAYMDLILSDLGTVSAGCDDRLGQIIQEYEIEMNDPTGANSYRAFLAGLPAAFAALEVHDIDVDIAGSRLCNDSCGAGVAGECDDRDGAACAFGTDCTDCGVRLSPGSELAGFLATYFPYFNAVGNSLGAGSGHALLLSFIHSDSLDLYHNPGPSPYTNVHPIVAYFMIEFDDSMPTQYRFPVLMDSEGNDFETAVSQILEPPAAASGVDAWFSNNSVTETHLGICYGGSVLIEHIRKI